MSFKCLFKLVRKTPTAMNVWVQVIIVSLLFLILGIISEYIALILDEVKQRPNFIIRRKIGFDDEQKVNL